ncbi:TIGR03086 family metal-binding protein [Streptomyces sp. NPDC050418]|uniref:TIGR03086 family metal-binding protein n=1 Tax=Streptomyces sp. NPDC050418 TaxID=3365612 RepID=UPI0037BB414B
MTQWTLLDDAHAALRAAIRDLPQSDLDAPTPCTEWTVTQVIHHAAGDQLGYASALTDGPGPTYNPFEPPAAFGERTPGDLVEPALRAAAAAWATVDKDASEVRVPIPPGLLTAELGAGACALDAAVHAWDIAMATGRPSPLTDELAEALLPTARATTEAVRAFAYGPALEGPDEDGPAAVLLRYLGRSPDWKR